MCVLHPKQKSLYIFAKRKTAGAHSRKCFSVLTFSEGSKLPVQKCVRLRERYSRETPSGDTGFSVSGPNDSQCEFRLLVSPILTSANRHANSFAPWKKFSGKKLRFLIQSGTRTCSSFELM